MEKETKRKKTGGRQPGSLNKATAEVKAVAADYAPIALAELGRLSTGAISEQARVAACKEILDRAYGKAHQHVEVDHSGSVNIQSASISLLDALIAGTADTAASAAPSHPLPN